MTLSTRIPWSTPPALDAASLREDWHVHSTWSDGRHTLEENLEAAREAGLRRLVCVDHVRRDTTWVPDYLAAVAALDARDLDVQVGVEAKLLTLDGALDVPDDLPESVRVYVADHQMPWLAGPLHPRTVRAGFATGELRPGAVLDGLCTAYARSVQGRPGVVIAHPFSILPKMGLREDALGEARVRFLGRCLARAGAIVEVSERWRCPNQATAGWLAAEGVRLVASSDAHKREAIGAYAWLRGLPRASRAC